MKKAFLNWARLLTCLSMTVGTAITGMFCHVTKQSNKQELPMTATDEPPLDNNVIFQTFLSEIPSGHWPGSSAEFCRKVYSRDFDKSVYYCDFEGDNGYAVFDSDGIYKFEPSGDLLELRQYDGNLAY